VGRSPPVSAAALVCSARERCPSVAAVYVPCEHGSQQQLSGKSVCQAFTESGLEGMTSCSGVSGCNLERREACSSKGTFAFVLHVEECLLCTEVHPVCAILGALRDRGQTKRNKNKTRKAVSWCFTAWSMQHLAQTAWRCVPLRSGSALQAGTSTLSRPGMATVVGVGEAPCGLR